jgi:hypothetical protein
MLLPAGVGAHRACKTTGSFSQFSNQIRIVGVAMPFGLPSICGGGESSDKGPLALPFIYGMLPMDDVGSETRLREIAARFSKIEHVESVALAVEDYLFRGWKPGTLRCGSPCPCALAS